MSLLRSEQYSDDLKASIQVALDASTEIELAQCLHDVALVLMHELDTLQLPASVWCDPFPNPPRLVDRHGQIVEGELVPEWPARKVAIQKFTAHGKLGHCDVDGIAETEDGQIGLVFHVHPLSLTTKIGNASTGGVRVLEIDLHSFSKRSEHIFRGFGSAIADELTNRRWLVHPAATSAWDRSFANLEKLLTRSRLRPRWHEDAESDVEVVALEANLKSYREQNDVRAQRGFRRALEALPLLTAKDYVEARLESHWARDGQLAEAKLATIEDFEVVKAIQAFHPNAWIFDWHPLLWQCSLYKEFIEPLDIGERLDKVVGTRWLRQEVGAHPVLAVLFDAQYADVRSFQARGRHLPKIRASFFTEDENAAIPNLFDVVNDFYDRLIAIGVLQADPQSPRYCVRT